jgi:hypothetical protein
MHIQHIESTSEHTEIFSLVYAYFICQ